MNDLIKNIVFVKDLGMIYPTINSKHKSHYGLFNCPHCNNNFKSRIQDVNNNKVKSCGCMKSEFKRLKKTTHGLKKTRLYNIYNSMKNRCSNLKCKNYNGLGITVCQEWRDDINSFVNWALNNGYNDSLELDRIKNDLGYSPDNCRWVTRSQNMQNTRLLIKTNTSGFRGVSFVKKTKKYVSYIKINNKKIYLGSFIDSKDAAITYNNFVISNNLRNPLNIIL